MKTTLLTPFEKFSELQLLLAGLLLTAAGSYTAFLTNTRLDGVMDAHTTSYVQLQQPFIDNVINTFSLFITLYGLGLYINKKTRVIDILNTAMIARAPLYLSNFTNINGYMESLAPKLIAINPANITLTIGEMVFLGVTAILAIGTLIWFVMLLFNGFKTATNLKAVGQKVAFAFAIILAEVISKLLIGAINY